MYKGIETSLGYAPVKRNPIAEVIPWHVIVLLLAAHAGLALWMYHDVDVATAHALLTLGLGLVWVVMGRLDRVVHTAAYIAGAEVLWRMTEANVFWEYGKYATVALLFAAIIRFRKLKPPSLVLLYFLLLLPSVWLTVQEVSPGLARQLVSFNLSGPLALFVVAWFFRQLPLTAPTVRRLVLAFMLPVTGVATNAIFNTITATDLVFSTASNAITSGGFGPNQVAAVLGFGALLAMLYLVITRQANAVHRGVVIAILLLLVFQSALTFSRGGLAMALGAAVGAGVFLLTDRRSRWVLIAVTLLLYGFAEFVMLPTLNEFTQGYFVERYSDLSSTGRYEIALSDLRIFAEHALLGVGPGLSSVYRAEWFGSRLAAHTEFTRLLAEHGIPGIFALVFAVWVGWRNFKAVRIPVARALTAGLLTWTLLFMLINGFRLVAPALAFGLTFARLLPEVGYPPRKHTSREHLDRMPQVSGAHVHP